MQAWCIVVQHAYVLSSLVNVHLSQVYSSDLQIYQCCMHACMHACIFSLRSYANTLIIWAQGLDSLSAMLLGLVRAVKLQALFWTITPGEESSYSAREGIKAQIFYRPIMNIQGQACKHLFVINPFCIQTSSLPHIVSTSYCNPICLSGLPLLRAIPQKGRSLLQTTCL